GKSARGGGDLVVEDQGVEGHEAADAAAVQSAHHLRQLSEIETDLGPRREMVESEIDRVGAGLDGGAQLWPVSGRTHDFGFTAWGHRRVYLQVNIGAMRPLRLFILIAAVAAAGAQTLWHDPGEIEKMDFATAAEAPRPPFTFLREDPSGTQPKLFVRDAGGRTWNVKFGYEVHNEAFAWRLVRACGYFAEPSYFVASGKVEGYKPLRRASESITAD